MTPPPVVAIYLSSSYRVQSSSRILSACGWYLLTVVRGPMTITRHPCTGSGITFIAAALMPIVVATISASSDAVFFSTASASKFFHCEPVKRDALSSVRTNGSFIDEEVIERLCQTDICQLMVSLDVGAGILPFQQVT